ncbi:hypothetical protein LZL78_31635 [Pseudomonas aeruginosa]|nr:hypothetical protein [Pseudomonas aeruginosa]
MKIKAKWGFVGDAVKLGAESAKVKAGQEFEDVDDEYAHILIGKGLAVEVAAKGRRPDRSGEAEAKAKAEAEAKAKAEAEAREKEEAEAKAKAEAEAEAEAKAKAEEEANAKEDKAAKPEEKK